MAAIGKSLLLRDLRPLVALQVEVEKGHDGLFQHACLVKQDVSANGSDLGTTRGQNLKVVQALATGTFDACSYPCVLPALILAATSALNCASESNQCADGGRQNSCALAGSCGRARSEYR